MTRILVSLALLLVLPSASFSQTISVCDGRNVKWPSTTVPLRASVVSFPTGNAFTAALDNVANFWNNNPSRARITLTLGDNSVDFENGQSEVWFTDDSDYNPAVALTWYDGCEIDEVDILFYVNVGYVAGTQNGTTKSVLTSYGGAGRPFQTTAAHEFGHAFGLEHENRMYNLMGEDFTYLNTNGTTVRAYSGGASSEGVVILYGLNAAAAEDVSISHWKFVGTTGDDGEYSDHGRTEVFGPDFTSLTPTTVSGEPRFDAVIGGQAAVEFAYENNGAHALTWMPIQFVLSDDATIDAGDRLLGVEAFNILDRGAVAEAAHTLFLPNDLTLGQDYFIGAVADPWNSITEFDEQNNATYVRVRAQSSTPTALTLSPAITQGGEPVIGHVILSGAAPPAGAVVSLASTDASIAWVPATVTVSAGAWIGEFAVQTADFVGCGGRSADISATRGGVTVSARLDVVLSLLEAEACNGPFDWIEWRELVGICLDWSVDRGTGMIQKCPPPPSCPECIYSLAGEKLPVPTYFKSIQENVLALSRTADRGQMLVNSVRRIRRLLMDAPVGPNYDESLRASVLHDVDEVDRSKRLAAALSARLAAVLSAIELDIRLGQSVENMRVAPRGQADLDHGVHLAVSNAQALGTATVQVRSGMPAAVAGFSPGWPVATYSVTYTGQLSARGYFDVSFSLHALNFAGDPATLRVLRWNGKTYEDVTSSLDLRRRVITARTRTLGDFVLVNQSDRWRPGQERRH